MFSSPHFLPTEIWQLFSSHAWDLFTHNLRCSISYFLMSYTYRWALISLRPLSPWKGHSSQMWSAPTEPGVDKEKFQPRPLIYLFSHIDGALLKEGNLRRDTHNAFVLKADAYVFDLKIQGLFSRLSFHSCLRVLQRSLVLLSRCIGTMLSFHFPPSTGSHIWCHAQVQVLCFWK